MFFPPESLCKTNPCGALILYNAFPTPDVFLLFQRSCDIAIVITIYIDGYCSYYYYFYEIKFKILYNAQDKKVKQLDWTIGYTEK